MDTELNQETREIVLRSRSRLSGSNEINPCLSCCHSGGHKCFRRDGEDVCKHKVSSKTPHCQGEGGGVESYCSQDDGADQWVGEEANGVTERRGNRIVKAQEAGQLVKGNRGNLASEYVDQVLDDPAVVAAAV